MITDDVIQQRVMQTEQWKVAKKVHIYKALKDEVATNKLVNNALNTYKEISFPFNDPLDNPTDVDLVIVPGRSFDKQCGRRGRGRGYYDRYLSLLNVCRYTLFVGIAYDKQIVDQLKLKPWDVSVDLVITQSKVFTEGFDEV